MTGLNPGEDAKVVVAAVDVGILNLTNYKPPAPDDYYLGQRRLTAEIRDLYGQLIDGMQGTRGQLKTGGDSAGAELQGSPPTQKPLALYSGIVTVAADGTAEISFDIPEFAGTARVMAVAWTATKLGRATVDVTVRDPVVLTATLPRFLLNGDHGTMSFDLDNVEGAPGDYTVSVKAAGPVKVSGNPVTTAKLAAKQRSSMSLALDAGGAGSRSSRRRYQGTERSDAGAALCARCEAGDADSHAPFGPHAGEGRKPDPDLRHVLRSGAKAPAASRCPQVSPLRSMRRPS